MELATCEDAIGGKESMVNLFIGFLVFVAVTCLIDLHNIVA